MANWMIYGANGYSAKLIIELAVSQGLRPILAGRNRAAISALASQYQLDYRIYELSELKNKSSEFKDIKVLLNCAGPFEETFDVISSICLENAIHYFDITGEMKVFEAAFKLDKKAKEAKSIICPGVGFDVVPTDCLALKLKKLLPTATHLELGFMQAASLSPGTTKTMLRSLPAGGKVRLNHSIVSVPFLYQIKEIEFKKDKKLQASCIPWGDVQTAHFTTSIPNICVYAPLSPGQKKFLKMIAPVQKALTYQFVLNLFDSLISTFIKGPSETEREQSVYVWGYAYDQVGSSQTLRLKTPNGYTLTALTAVEVVKRTLEGQVNSFGYQTPAVLFGEDFILQFLETKNWIQQ